MVKVRVSVSLDESTWHKIRESMRKNRRYRNKSHLVEDAILKLVEGDIENE